MKLIYISKAKLLDINEIGEIMADSIINYFTDIKNQELINRCINNGIIFKKRKTIQSNITNKVFVFTGHLNSFSRREVCQNCHLV